MKCDLRSMRGIQKQRCGYPCDAPAVCEPWEGRPSYWRHPIIRTQVPPPGIPPPGVLTNHRLCGI
jgi:hypothetical protein